MNKKDQEWIAYCQKIRVEERNKAIDECIEVLLDMLEDKSNTRDEMREGSSTIKQLEALKITTSNPEQS